MEKSWNRRGNLGTRRRDAEKIPPFIPLEGENFEDKIHLRGGGCENLEKIRKKMYVLHLHYGSFNKFDLFLNKWYE